MPWDERMRGLENRQTDVQHVRSSSANDTESGRSLSGRGLLVAMAIVAVAFLALIVFVIVRA
jgi:hypothetical protein